MNWLTGNWVKDGKKKLQSSIARHILSFEPIPLKQPAKNCKGIANDNTETSVIENHPDALLVEERKRIFTTEPFQNGWFEVQDASSQEVAYFMDLKPGMRVIDACAGGGGKSLHMAAIMQNKGRIISLDIFEWKLKELKRRAKRAGVSIMETRLIESSKTIKKLADNC